MSTVHTTLDVIGMVPGFDAADLINSGIYLLEGDYINAGISLAAVVPVLGVAATAGKAINKAEKASGLTKSTILKWLDDVDTMDPQKLKSDLLNVGFNRLPGPKENYQYGNFIIRLDAPHGNVNYYHMHIEKGRKRSDRIHFNHRLERVNKKDMDRHIPIMPW